jgi:RNA polymerase sigma factor (TIGR02999 family)
MMPTASPRFTDLLRAVQSGDKDAADRLFERVYDELRRLAHVVRSDGAPDTLNTTALLHEAYLHLNPGARLDIESKRHFFAIAARAMRQVVAHAYRHRGAQKRGGDAVTVAFSDHMLGCRVAVESLVTIEDALAQLERMSDRQARVVECRFYAGLSVEETADVLEVSASTVKRDWRAAKAWLVMHLSSYD